MSGKLIAVGGLGLGITGVVQGIGNFQEAKAIAEATDIRKMRMEKLDELTTNSDIIGKVKSIDKITPLEANQLQEEALIDAKKTLPDKQTKAQEDKVIEKDKITEEEKNDRIKLINQDYEASVTLAKTEASKPQSLSTPAQATYYVAQGLSEYEKAKSQKENLIEQAQQDSQNQQGNIAEDIRKEINKLAEFDPFQRNSSNLRG